MEQWPHAQRRWEAGIDVDRANAARMYDYFLDGAHNFAVDRDLAHDVIARLPDIVRIARANRAYLGRVVTWCLQRGIDQFIDLGSGVPTVGNVHEIAHATRPDARVAYVDVEPVAVAHAEELTAALDTVTVTRADLRDPDSVLSAPGVAGLLDFTRPVALIAIAVLHFVPADVGVLVARYRAALAPGSVVALSHACDEVDDPEFAERLRAGVEAYRGSATTMHLRSRAELAPLLDGLTLSTPMLVDLTDWPDPDPTTPEAGGVAIVGTV